MNWREEQKSRPTSQNYSNEESLFYTGKPYLASSGGYAFKYRSYNPKIARWTSEDPSGFPDGSNNQIYSRNPLSGIDPNGLAWSNVDFIKHFYKGGGASVDLGTIGLLPGVRNVAEKGPSGGAYKFEKQIEVTAEGITKPFNGLFDDSFSNTYSFKKVCFSLGSGVLSGVFVGDMSSTAYTDGRNGGTYAYHGLGTIRYSDSFTDPTSVIEYLYGSSTGGPSWLKAIANGGGTPFQITGKWNMTFSGALLKHGSGVYE